MSPFPFLICSLQQTELCKEQGITGRQSEIARLKGGLPLSFELRFFHHFVGISAGHQRATCGDRKARRAWLGIPEDAVGAVQGAKLVLNSFHSS